MKRTFLFHTFFWCFLLGLAFTTVAQEHSLGRAPNQPDQKTDRIEVSELLQTAAYGTEGATNTLYEFDLPAGTIVGPIGSGSPTLVQGADFGPAGVYYGTQNNTDLISIDIGTGAYTFVATITGITGGQTITGVGYDELSDIMYLGTTNITTSELYTLDVGTGAATLVGVIGQAGLITIAVDCNGDIYSADLVTDDLWSIDPGTGAGTVIGPLGIDINFCQDADFDPATGVMWFAAYTAQGELGTVDLTTGAFTLVSAIIDEYCSFAVSGSCGPPCPVGDPSNPSPTNGAIGVDINVPQISWTNGSGATQIEVFFDGTSVYTGVPVTSYAITGPLDYSTTYTWKVNGSDGTCWKFGPNWSFTTMDNPSITTVFYEDFDGSWSGTWTMTNNGGTCDWIIGPNWRPYGTPGTSGNLLYADSDDCGSGTTMNTTATMDQGVDMTGLTDAVLYFGHDYNDLGSADMATVEYSIDGGSTWTLLVTFDGADIIEIWDSGPMPVWDGQADLRFRFTYVAGWDWWWAIDNIFIDALVPVELTSFTASVNENNVTLNWVTASEINNLGFEVQRKTADEFSVVGFINGNGTTTERHSYMFIDEDMEAGQYTYRLKQLDLDGTFEYSDVIEVDITVPDVFALEQNYPNPFNPSTKINFSLAVDSKVSLKVFDVLGQEVVTLISSDLVAGTHNVNFSAASMNSGVYFYRIEATGIDGTNFTSVKKMLLTK